MSRSELDRYTLHYEHVETTHQYVALERAYERISAMVSRLWRRG